LNEERIWKEIINPAGERTPYLIMKIELLFSIQIYFMKQITSNLKRDMKIDGLTSQFYLGGGNYRKLTKFLRSLSINILLETIAG
jgi:hypothetical protein